MWFGSRGCRGGVIPRAWSWSAALHARAAGVSAGRRVCRRGWFRLKEKRKAVDHPHYVVFSGRADIVVRQRREQDPPSLQKPNVNSVASTVVMHYHHR